MNKNVVWALVAVALYWLAIPAVGTEWTRNIVAVGGVIVSTMNVLRYMPKAAEKFHTGASAGEWRLLMGLELFWLGFGAREVYLFGDRFGEWDATGNPLNGFFAFWILCAGLLCFSAVREPLPEMPHQNAYVLGAVAVAGALVGALAYRWVWG